MSKPLVFILRTILKTLKVLIEKMRIDTSCDFDMNNMKRNMKT